jgi:hypothetical protein
LSAGLCDQRFVLSVVKKLIRPVWQKTGLLRGACILF